MKARVSPVQWSKPHSILTLSRHPGFEPGRPDSKSRAVSRWPLYYHCTLRQLSIHENVETSFWCPSRCQAAWIRKDTLETGNFFSRSWIPPPNLPSLIPLLVYTSKIWLIQQITKFLTLVNVFHSAACSIYALLQLCWLSKSFGFVDENNI